MEDRGSIEFAYYTGGIKSSFCEGLTTLSQFVESNQNPDKEQRALFDKIRAASLAGDKKLKTKLKERLLFFTPAVSIKEGYARRYDNIESFTGLAQLDFDGLEVEVATDLKHYLFEHYPQLHATYLSPSKKGVKGLIRIPIVDSVKEFQDYYRAIAEEFSAYDGFDEAPKNAVLPLFQSYDPFLNYRSNPKEWDIKKEEEIPMHERFPIPPKPYRGLKSNERNRNRAINTVTKMINNIVDSPGHTQLRSACLIFGTRVGMGYVDYSEALLLVENLVRSNAYLAKGVRGYLKTARWGVEEGRKTPKPY